MKLGVFYHHILEAAEQRNLSIVEVLKRVKEWGIDFLDCSPGHLKNNKTEIKSMFDDNDIKVSSLYTWFNFGLEENYDDAYRFIDLADFFQANKVLVIPGFIRDQDKGQKEIMLKKMVYALDLICKYAKTKNIIVTMEDYDDKKAPYATDKELLWFMKQLPDLRCTFDTGNFKYSGIDEVKAFDLLKDKIVHVHGKDRSLVNTNNEPEQTAINGTLLYPSPLGYGCIQIKTILDKLVENGYNDVLTIEHFGAKDQMNYMEKSAKWLLNNIEQKC